jgi:hypothetical protein
VSFRYNVSSLNGFSLAGTPDAGSFNPLLLQVDTPTIRFAIEPSQPDDLTDRCHTHSRNAFRDTVKFLGLTLYVDFPNDPAGCHNTDPQGPPSTKAEAGEPALERAVAFLKGDLIDVRIASTDGADLHGYLRLLAGRRFGSSVAHLLAALYFFHAADGSCKAPILFLTTTP